ncbi:hypothetical protein [Paenibacillus ginsengarvi]|uniref:Uncharacterized protein n=1 Tax=Paenibacillus ginsengarvi TaxID=400777 RepID=A0A3B0CBD1_9BACL|nr:hypothetical protein [Paenibacillus ginsengarvi]RKN81968.1 hypothetical protein D7M11_18490 [Paenibacillus ginsengarvi]
MYCRFKRNATCPNALLIVVISSFFILTGCMGDKSETGIDRQTAVQTASSISHAVEAVLSASDKMPDGFPKQIPIPRDAEMLASMKYEDSMTVAFDVKKSFDETLKIYKEYFKSAGYQMANETLIGDSFVGTGTLEGNKLTVMISMTTEDNRLSSVSLTYQTKK